MADGWEVLLSDMLDPADLAAAATGRAAGPLAVASTFGEQGEGVRFAAYRWACADLGIHLSDAQERAAVAGLLAGAGCAGAVPRAARPIAVLAALSERAFSQGRSIGTPGDFVRAVRIGLVGR